MEPCAISIVFRKAIKMINVTKPVTFYIPRRHRKHVYTKKKQFFISVFDANTPLTIQKSDI